VIEHSRAGSVVASKAPLACANASIAARAPDRTAPRPATMIGCWAAASRSTNRWSISEFGGVRPVSGIRDDDDT